MWCVCRPSTQTGERDHQIRAAAVTQESGHLVLSFALAWEPGSAGDPLSGADRSSAGEVGSFSLSDFGFALGLGCFGATAAGFPVSRVACCPWGLPC